MKINTWHWAKLKMSVQIDDEYILSFLKSNPFIIAKGTIVWAFLCPYTKHTHITVGPRALEYNTFAHQPFRLISYSSLLEPLE